MDLNNIDKLCINCMQENPTPGGICPHCGFNVQKYVYRPHQLEPFTILKGRYLLGSVLGEGGFGITYVALDLLQNQKVAIKELFVASIFQRNSMRTNAVLVDSSQDARNFYQQCKERFLQEASILIKLDNKRGVVNIFDFFTENNTAYIVMEYLDGDDLKEYLNKRGGSISFQEAYTMLRPVMKSMIELHSEGIYHRDISPDNIRYLSNNSMKIMDLGGAKNNYANSQTEFIMVKQGYAPPEQYSNGFKIGPWMDVYAMSATFYRCITGKVPKESINRLNDSDLEKPRELGADISKAAEKVLLKAMSLDSNNRYLDMREFYNALKVAMKEKKKPIIPGEVAMPLLIHLKEKKFKKTEIAIGVFVGVMIIIIIYLLVRK